MQTVVSDLHLIELNGVNVYLWTGEGGPTLIDTGYPWTYAKLVDELASAGVQPADLQRIILTHADLDHIGGLRALREACDAPACCHAVEAAYIQGEESKKPGGSALGFAIRPVFSIIRRRYNPGIPRVEELVVEGKQLPEGFRVIHVPGHAPGQIALYHEERSVLITGDALTNRDGKLDLPPAMFTPDMDAAKESLRKFKKLHYETACFGHGPPILSDAGEILSVYIDSLNLQG